MLVLIVCNDDSGFSIDPKAVVAVSARTSGLEGSEIHTKNGDTFITDLSVGQVTLELNKALKEQGQ